MVEYSAEEKKEDQEVKPEGFLEDKQEEPQKYQEERKQEQEDKQEEPEHQEQEEHNGLFLGINEDIMRRTPDKNLPEKEEKKEGDAEEDHKQQDEEMTEEKNREDQKEEIAEEKEQGDVILVREEKPALTISKDKKRKIDSKSNFWQNKSRWLIPLLLILIVVSTSTYLRMAPLEMPDLKNKAEENILNIYRETILRQTIKDYPNFPPPQIVEIVERELEYALQNNREEINDEIERHTQLIKDEYRDEEGNVYLQGVDPYLWYSQTKNVLNHGHLGDKMIDGVSHFSLRDGRLDKKTTLQLHPYIAAYYYKIMQVFNRNISLMRSLSLLPVFLIALSIIFIFFIGRRVGGNSTGFFAALFLAINKPLLARSSAGFADTDPYNVFFPLLITWLFLEGYLARKRYLRWSLLILAGLFVGIYSITWGGWIFIFFFILGALALTALLNNGRIILGEKNKFKERRLKESRFKEGKIKFALQELWKKISLKKYLVHIGGFLLSSGIFVFFIAGRDSFINKFLAYTRFASIQSSVFHNSWPMVQKSVAEFEKISILDYVSNIGGKIFILFVIAGLIYTFFKKNKENKPEYIYFSLLVVWLIGAGYALTKGIRFSLLMAPALSLTLGLSFAFIFKRGSTWLSEKISLDKIISFILVGAILAIILFTPLSLAYQTTDKLIPMFNDAWQETLTKIKEDSPDSIITSWWDFGYWFIAMAERRTTFDGGDQKRRVHWVGKTLVTEDEKEAVSILRMLNCAQEKASRRLDEITEDTLKTIEIIDEVLSIADQDQARERYMELGLTPEEANEIVEYTHCKNLLPNYFITSEDMVGKAIAWTYYGNWNFERALISRAITGMSAEEKLDYLTERFDFTEDEASNIINEMEVTETDQWISPKLRFFGEIRPCQKSSENEISCTTPIDRKTDLKLTVDLTTYDVSIKDNPQNKPFSIVYADGDKIVEKKFAENVAEYSVFLVQDGKDYGFALANPEIAFSLFSRLFLFDGLGTKCFDKFQDVTDINNERIVTWKVDYGCLQEDHTTKKTTTETQV